MRLLLGTRNRGKIAEIVRILSDVPRLELYTSEDVPFADVAETGSTFVENAHLKARQISSETGYPVLAEDSGLEVDALDGAPGIHTARFAGVTATIEANIAKLLTALDGVEDRSARFVCVAVLHRSDRDEIVTEGELRGRIARDAKGDGGFGYDPVFIPDGYGQTLAELGDEIKREISHRRRALDGIRDELLRTLASTSTPRAEDDQSPSSSS